MAPTLGLSLVSVFAGVAVVSGKGSAPMRVGYGGTPAARGASRGDSGAQCECYDYQCYNSTNATSVGATCGDGGYDCCTVLVREVCYTGDSNGKGCGERFKECWCDDPWYTVWVRFVLPALGIAAFFGYRRHLMKKRAQQEVAAAEAAGAPAGVELQPVPMTMTRPVAVEGKMVVGDMAAAAAAAGMWRPARGAMSSGESVIAVCHCHAAPSNPLPDPREDGGE